MAKTKHAKSQQSTRTTDHTASLTYLYRATVLEFGRFSNLVSPVPMNGRMAIAPGVKLTLI
jgi:hypothetical protein